MAGIAFFVWRMNDHAYRPVYSDLTEAEAGTAAQRLDELNVPYKLAASGTTIMVPE